MKVLIALGGNAIKKREQAGTSSEQLLNVEKTCKRILEIVKLGSRVVIIHGNGPQVGNLLIQQEEGKNVVPEQPLDVLGAMTQGQVGYMIQQTLENYFIDVDLNIPVITMITQVLVDENDPDFDDPSKPIGPFYTEIEAERLQKEKGYTIKKVDPQKNRPYRRVVPSPIPIDIIEKEAVKRIVDSGIVLISSGGGGVPVVLKDNGRLVGVEAVIDKDLAGELLAEIIEADIFISLTDVDNAKVNYGKPDEEDLQTVSLTTVQKYYNEGHFLPGSMGPKVLACIKFLKSGGKKAIITSLEKALESLEGKAGTIILPT